MTSSSKRKSEYISDEFVVDDDDDGSGHTTKKTKTPNSTDSTTQTDNEGNKYWEISKARRITISEFKGKSLVNIREYYQKDGDWLPGKKGISLTVEQFSTLISVLPHLESALKSKGEKIPRPEYSDGQSTKKSTTDLDDESEDEDDKKANIDATSDEEDD